MNNGFCITLFFMTLTIGAAVCGEEIKMRIVDNTPDANLASGTETMIQAPLSRTHRPFSMELWGGLGTMGGNATYQIGGFYATSAGESGFIHFPLSELKWPENVLMASVGGNLFIAKHVEIIAQLSGNLNSDAGAVEDSDWGDVSRPYLRTTYSRSDADFDTSVADISVRFWVLNMIFDRYNSWRIGIGCGILYQDSHWKASNVDQWYPASPNLGHDYYGGLAAAYDLELTMPYIDISGEWNIPWFTFIGSMAYAPRITVKDEDNHYLRYILATSDLKGDAIRLTMQARCDFTDYVYGVLRMDFLDYVADGTEYDTVYAGDDEGDSWTIDHKVTGIQEQFYAGLGLKF